jgi:sarcosine oxidase subunit beta
MSPDVIVLGAGVIGGAIAFDLARRGAAVLLVDRAHPAAAPSASWASAGGLRSQGRHAAEHALTLRAAARWRTLGDELGADLESRFGGHLHLAETAAETETLHRRAALDAAGGIDVAVLSAPEMRERFPGLTSHAVAGLYSRADGQAHAGRTARAFAAAAARQGAMLRFSREACLVISGGAVQGLRFADGETVQAPQVVVAAGAWSAALLAACGVTLPLRARALQMLLSEVAAPGLAPTVTAVGRNLSLKQLPSGQFMVGGRWFAACSGGDFAAATPIADQVARQWATAVAVLPALAGLRLSQVWAGVEAQSIDGLPFIGPAAIDGLYLATGFSNHGFQISPAVGELVADALAGLPAPLLAAFAPSRPLLHTTAELTAFVDEPLTV